MIHPALDETRRSLLAETRRLLAGLEGWRLATGAGQELEQALADSQAQLDDGFLLVVVGEFNTGKSAFINALLGRPVLEEGVTPTTARITRLCHGEAGVRHEGRDGVVTIGAPAEILRWLSIVDTPGTNAVLREHEALTREFVPRADLVLFLTSADRPLSESERTFLEALREWGKKVVVIVNKADLLASTEQREQVVAFVREHAGRALATAPEVFALSVRMAAQARADADRDRLAASGLPAFETRVTARLDEAERFRLKLANPAGVAHRVRSRLAELVARRLELLDGDVVTLEAVAGLLAAHAGRLAADFALRLSDVEKVLLDFEQRGRDFFDARLRLARARELLDRERLRRDFEQTVVADLAREVERRVEAIVDWMVGEELALWQELMRLLRDRQAAHADRLTAPLDERFRLDRSERVEAVGQAATQAVAAYDAAAEGRRLAERMREAVAGAALLEVSALGLGTIVAALASSTAADVSGLLAAGALAVLGLLVLPMRRRQARRELGVRVEALRETLLAALRGSFERERGRAAGRVREALEPYERFVRGERERLRDADGGLAQLGRELTSLVERTAAFGRDDPALASP